MIGLNRNYAILFDYKRVIYKDAIYFPMKTIGKILKKIKELTKKDNEKTREEIEKLCHRILNEEFYEYMVQDCAVQDVIDELSVMDEIEGRKEPKILHMPLEEVKKIFDDLKKAVE